jgi:hypothetical protein
LHLLLLKKIACLLFILRWYYLHYFGLNVGRIPLFLYDFQSVFDGFHLIINWFHVEINDLHEIGCNLS